MATPPHQRRPVNPTEPKADARSVAGLTVDARTILAGNVARLERPELEEVARSVPLTRSERLHRKPCPHSNATWEPSDRSFRTHLQLVR